MISLPTCLALSLINVFYTAVRILRLYRSYCLWLHIENCVYGFSLVSYSSFFNRTIVLSEHQNTGTACDNTLASLIEQLFYLYISLTFYLLQFMHILKGHTKTERHCLWHSFKSYLHWCTCLLNIISSFNVFSLSNSKLTLLAKYLFYDLAETELWIWSTRLIWISDSALSNVGGRGNILFP